MAAMESAQAEIARLTDLKDSNNIKNNLESVGVTGDEENLELALMDGLNKVELGEYENISRLRSIISKSLTFCIGKTLNPTLQMVIGRAIAIGYSELSREDFKMVSSEILTVIRALASEGVISINKGGIRGPYKVFVKDSLTELAFRV